MTWARGHGEPGWLKVDPGWHGTCGRSSGITRLANGIAYSGYERAMAKKFLVGLRKCTSGR